MSNVMKPRKAAVIGCGFVGSATAFTLMQSKLFSELVLLDVNADKADGEAKDISHGIPFAAPMKVYAGDYDDVADAAVIIVTAGANQKPDESRLDLVHRNVEIYKSIIPRIAYIAALRCCSSIFLMPPSERNTPTITPARRSRISHTL